MGRSLAFVVAMWILAGCTSTQLVKDKDYQFSMNAFRQGNAQKALESFPTQERGGFITSVERSWLGFWNGQPEVDSILAQTRTFDERKFVSVTREAKVFLTQESEEGYVPSEHEVVFLHLVAAMNHMALEKWEEAEVDARRAAFYLQNPFNENQPHFDDAALRLWLAGVWSALGKWESARVDLRRAASLSGDPRLAALAEESEPSHLTVTFEGVGPELRWPPLSALPEFVPPPAGETKATFTASTLPWARHHAERNTLLRDALVRSNYMSQSLRVETINGAVRGVGTAGALSLGAAGVATGAGLIGGAIYLSPHLTSYDGGKLIVALGVIGIGVVFYSNQRTGQVIEELNATLAADKKKELEKFRAYRIVRFMPNWVSLDPRETTDGSWMWIRKDLKAPRSKTSTVFKYVF